MELKPGQIAVVTGAGSGIGLALANRFAAAGLQVVLADVDATALAAAAREVGERGVDTLEVVCDVSDEAAVQALASATVERFGTAHVVCNNAGVMSSADPWSGPLSTWQWVIGVNLWGVVHGVRAFLPILAAQGEGHIVNTASIAGLLPGFGPSYDASKHAVVAITEDLYRETQMSGSGVGVSVLCPGWVRTGILDAERNWPAEHGEAPPSAEGAEISLKYVRRAIDEGTTPAAVADLVADAVEADRFWVFPHPDFLELAIQRWHEIAEGQQPALMRDTPGMPPMDEIIAEVLASLEAPGV
ncbi:MAG TPA: SDR family NAD(P)-dependent oxidoreductase [Acidimicrobiales bacterium]